MGLSTLLLAAWCVLLFRYSGQEDVLIGMASDGRLRAAERTLLGMFMQPVVIRSSPTGSLSFRNVLRQVQHVLRAAQSHQGVPVDLLTKALQTTRHLGQDPLFQVFFALEPAPPLLPAGWTAARIQTGTSLSDLSLLMEDLPGALTGRFEYRTDLFDEATIARMVGHWQALLEGIVAHPDQLLSRLPLLTEEERQQVLVGWNATQAPYPKDHSLHQLFEAQAERAPHAVAAVFEEQHLTYGELNARANQLARHLQRLGVGPEARVALCVERSVQMVVGLLGVLKAGGAYVPLDPAYPADRLAFMLEDSQASVLVTQRQLMERLPPHESVVCLDADWSLIARQSEENIADGRGVEHLAFVLYTSGSTGQPKGVLGTHRAAINRLQWMWTTYPFEPGEVCCQKTALSFVDSVWEIFGPLLQGVQTVILPDRVVKDPQQLLHTLATHAVTRIVLVPSLLQALLEMAADLQHRLPTLKYWTSSGEALPLDLAQRFLRSMPHSVLLNLYGSSEVAADATYYELRDVSTLTCIPIGRPIANTQVYVLDQHMQLLPAGVPGELYVAGDGLARGYFNRPELTAARFVPNPFSTEPGARLYKTGDRARFFADGTLEYLGRLDFQVKLRGFRIELGEIETVLGKHPAVGRAVVTLREDVPGDRRLVAYLTLRNEQTATLAELQQHAMNHLPDYMVPAAFVLVEAFPLTPNNKVDRRALPAPEPTPRPGEHPYVAPTSALQRQLVQIWEELLQVRPIGIKDDFFALGGHSLLAARMVNQVERICGKKLALATLFAGATIDYLAGVLMQPASENTSRVRLTAVQASGSRRPFFYVHGDWEGGSLYCVQLARHLGAEQPLYVLDPYRFDGMPALPSFEEMAAEHVEALRVVQPQGPYRLGGFCNGALIAYEMARQLHAQGQQVEILLLMNPINPAQRSRAYHLVRRLGTLLGSTPQQDLDRFLRVRHLWRSWLHLRGRSKPGKKPGQEAGQARSLWKGRRALLPPAAVLRQNWMDLYDWVELGYKAGVYPWKIAIFWTQTAFKCTRQWQEIVQGGEVIVKSIPGTHRTCRTTYACELAEQIQACLSEAEEVREPH